MMQDCAYSAQEIINRTRSEGGYRVTFAIR